MIAHDLISGKRVKELQEYLERERDFPRPSRSHNIQRTKTEAENTMRSLDKKFAIDRSSDDALIKSWSRLPRDFQMEYHRGHRNAYRAHDKAVKESQDASRKSAKKRDFERTVKEFKERREAEKPAKEASEQAKGT